MTLLDHLVRSKVQRLRYLWAFKFGYAKDTLYFRLKSWLAQKDRNAFIKVSCYIGYEMP